MYWCLSNVLATQPLCEEFCHQPGAVKDLVDHIFKVHKSGEPADLHAYADAIFSLCNLVTECSAQTRVDCIEAKVQPTIVYLLLE
jgi:hypothetical protein